jgi:hypothetical protein
MTLLLGFDLSIMANDLYDEAIIDVVAPEALLSKAYPIKVLLSFRYFTPSIHLITPRISYSVISQHVNLISHRLSNWFQPHNVEQKLMLSSYILTLSSLHQVCPCLHLLRSK